MKHVEPDVLALVALGEDIAEDAERAHLTSCPECAAEVEGFARAASTARTVTPADAIVMPPPQVWERIRAELDVDPALEPDGGHATPSRTGAASGRRRERAGGRSGSRSAPWLAAAAAAGVVVGAGSMALWGGTDGTAQPAVVAQADLDALPGWEAQAAARVKEHEDGTRELVVTLTGAEGVGGYREVWLIDRDVTRLFSLGVLEGDEGRFILPADLDLAEFPVVDVSDEPYDGDPAHSGDSIVRGLLDT